MFTFLIANKTTCAFIATLTLSHQSLLCMHHLAKRVYALGSRRSISSFKTYPPKQTHISRDFNIFYAAPKRDTLRSFCTSINAEQTHTNPEFTSHLQRINDNNFIAQIEKQLDMLRQNITAKQDISHLLEELQQDASTSAIKDELIRYIIKLRSIYTDETIVNSLLAELDRMAKIARQTGFVSRLQEFIKKEEINDTASIERLSQIYVDYLLFKISKELPESYTVQNPETILKNIKFSSNFELAKVFGVLSLMIGVNILICLYIQHLINQGAAGGHILLVLFIYITAHQLAWIDA